MCNKRWAMDDIRIDGGLKLGLAHFPFGNAIHKLSPLKFAAIYSQSVIGPKTFYLAYPYTW
jgi:hypothetical protein